ncbi:hypothetical protein J31TS6_50880 [Brevibacillus reuszeri]|nr:hypothetical protein J31TS6_50880 [Brevibacillus reuszeri]
MKSDLLSRFIPKEVAPNRKSGAFFASFRFSILDISYSIWRRAGGIHDENTNYSANDSIVFWDQAAYKRLGAGSGAAYAVK